VKARCATNVSQQHLRTYSQYVGARCQHLNHITG
jgi:hypothetical protein